MSPSEQQLGGSGTVTRIIAGTGVTITPPSGRGAVTVNADGGACTCFIALGTFFPGDLTSGVARTLAVPYTSLALVTGSYTGQNLHLDVYGKFPETADTAGQGARKCHAKVDSVWEFGFVLPAIPTGSEGLFPFTESGFGILSDPAQDHVDIIMQQDSGLIIVEPSVAIMAVALCGCESAFPVC